ncbi:MarR family transcriptional regulator [Solirubrobacter ginsenosidimutans]|uniref:MarR family transcriptional regulator n=1 Tax=Solirubrobacter ginsenosidimutans TaxID=490573 RepID=A0A9X3N4H4_9ACTN|nr:helix-turn-helix domain-containing protein [Solirubrobacter ginsenosidimutans]MDA0167096.1 MarR family transcriptional regulator [Solirubrobacter ginsenosidimutans]
MGTAPSRCVRTASPAIRVRRDASRLVGPLTVMAVTWRGAIGATTGRRGENHVVISVPRSDLLRRVLGCLRDHPHDDTVDRIARLLGMPAEAVHDALTALAEDGLVSETRSHWVLSRTGWASARADDVFGDLD